MPLRFINAMISGLAFHLAMKSRDPQARQMAPMLRELYEADFQLAADEDRERISFFASQTGDYVRMYVLNTQAENTRKAAATYVVLSSHTSLCGHNGATSARPACGYVPIA